MTGYQIALFFHLLALLAATAASSIVHFAAARRAAAATLRESMDWARLMGSTARVFPIAVITLMATGAYMTASHWHWRQGWVQAGFAGALLLLASGAVVGRRGAAEARATVGRLQSAGRELPNDGARDLIMALLSGANTGLALAIVLVMTIKPGLAASLAVLGTGVAMGAYLGRGRVHAKAALVDASEIEAA
ncbi:MAG: hypothetical protein WBQ26_01855 [Gemmatimonadaceae bacterium]|nr:hypothetical protein [Gemmatimonadaceae bacterium]